MKIIFKYISVALAAILISFLFVTHNRTSNITSEQNENIEQSGENEEKGDGALQYFQFLSEMRAWPNADIPSDGYYKGFEHSKNEMMGTRD